MLTAEAVNAQVEWVAGGALTGAIGLSPAVDVEVHAVPLDKRLPARVRIQGSMTGTRLLAYDLALFLLKTALALVPGSCLVSEEKLAFIALRTTDILDKSTDLALKRDFLGARDELLQVMDTFYTSAGSYAKDAAVDCALELFPTEKLKVKIAIAYLAWVPTYIYNYFKYEAQPASVVLTYTPASMPPTPVPTAPIATATPTIAPTPSKTAVLARETTIFEDYFADNRNGWVVGPGTPCLHRFWFAQDGAHIDARGVGYLCATGPAAVVSYPETADGFVYELELTVLEVTDPKGTIFHFPGGFKRGAYTVDVRADGTYVLWCFLDNLSLTSCSTASHGKRAPLPLNKKLMFKVRCDRVRIDFWLNGEHLIGLPHSQALPKDGITFNCANSCRAMSLDFASKAHVVYHHIRFATLEGGATEPVGGKRPAASGAQE